MKQITEQLKIDLGPYDSRMAFLVSLQESGLRPTERAKRVKRPPAAIGRTAAEGVMKQMALNLDPTDPKTNLSIYWDMLQKVDWHYEMIDGYNQQYIQGRDGYNRAASLRHESDGHEALFKAFSAYIHSNDANKTLPPRP